jgi:predicted membrane protein
MQPVSTHPAPQPQGQRSHSSLRSLHDLDPGRTVLGLAVVAIGVLYVLDNLGVLDAGSAIHRWWPLVIIAVGVSQLVTRSGSNVGPVVVIGIGSLLLLATTDALGEDAWSYVWPVALIGFGALVVLGRYGRARPAGAAPDEVVTATGIFGGQNVQTTSQCFKHASLTAVFGGVTLDLRDARLDPAGATITATAAFGGMDILVPHGWRIVTKTMPIFGGIGDKTETDGIPPAAAPTLVIDGLALFGGIEIKHQK